MVVSVDGEYWTLIGFADDIVLITDNMGDAIKILELDITITSI